MTRPKTAPAMLRAWANARAEAHTDNHPAMTIHQPLTPTARTRLPGFPRLTRARKKRARRTLDRILRTAPTQLPPETASFQTLVRQLAAGAPREASPDFRPALADARAGDDAAATALLARVSGELAVMVLRRLEDYPDLLADGLSEASATMWHTFRSPPAATAWEHLPCLQARWQVLSRCSIVVSMTSATLIATTRSPLSVPTELRAPLGRLARDTRPTETQTSTGLVRGPAGNRRSEQRHTTLPGWVLDAARVDATRAGGAPRGSVGHVRWERARGSDGYALADPLQAPRPWRDLVDGTDVADPRHVEDQLLERISKDTRNLAVRTRPDGISEDYWKSLRLLIGFPCGKDTRWRKIRRHWLTTDGQWATNLETLQADPGLRAAYHAYTGITPPAATRDTAYAALERLISN